MVKKLMSIIAPRFMDRAGGYTRITKVQKRASDGRARSFRTRMKDSYIIDAAGRKLGRVATEAAQYLMGKDRVTFTRRESQRLR